MRTRESSSAPSTALAAPDSPVRAPCGTTGTRWRVAQRRTAWTCSVVVGRTTPSGLPAGQELALSNR